MVHSWLDATGTPYASLGVPEILDVRNAFGKAGVHYVTEREDMLTMLIQAGADPELEIGQRQTGTREVVKRT